MLIVLGGLFGSNRVRVAELISLKKGIFRYDISTRKDHLYEMESDGNFKVIQPRNDKRRFKLYADVSKDLGLLSKMHPSIIVDDAFHRAGPRDFFLKEASRHFSPIVFVWIDSDSAQAYQNIRMMHAKKKIKSIPDALRTQD